MPYEPKYFDCYEKEINYPDAQVYDTLKELYEYKVGWRHGVIRRRKTWWTIPSKPNAAPIKASTNWQTWSIGKPGVWKFANDLKLDGFHLKEKANHA